jgi:ceramide glucosyltransferase
MTLFYTLLVCSLVGLVSSTVFLILVVKGVRRFRAVNRNAPPQVAAAAVLPAVSVLKPVRGLEPFLERNLESFFLQDYPDFELVFGARDEGDPAIEIIRSLATKYPSVRVRVVLSGEPLYANAKVYVMEQMVEVASASYLVITDSDVCVGKDCIRRVVSPLLDPDVGVVTCLYRGVAAGGFWSQLEALGMSVEMPSGVLVADMLEGMDFALGPTMATRKDILEMLGGMHTMGDYCADDFILGNSAHAAGKRVVLSDYIVEHIAMNTSMRASVLHQVRWMRSTRFSRPAGHAGTGLTYAMPFGFLGFLAGWTIHNPYLAAGLLLWAFLNRVVQCVVCGRGVVDDPNALRLAWVYPMRDLLGFFVWCASYFGRGITWRGEYYLLGPKGKMWRGPADAVKLP